MNQKIKEYLLEKFVKVSDDWISECINFITSVNKTNNTQNYLWMRNCVYEQWLHSDLTTLGTFCLPFGLVKQKSTTITGSFALQVNFIRDVGFPAYQQLQKLKKDDVENLNISAEKVHTAAWEAKPSRLLLLQLTDGTSVIQGMEYKPIPSLSLSMKPGIKILVKGSIEVRRGVLLLKNNHVTVLGGEIDNFLVSNAPENILRRTLNLEESANPNDVPGSLMTQSVAPTQELSNYYNTQNSQQTPLSYQTQNLVATCNSVFSQDFDDSSDLEMAMIEAEQKASTETFNNNFKKFDAMNSHPVLAQSSTVIPPKKSHFPRDPTTTFQSASIATRQIQDSNCQSRSTSFDDEPFADDDDLMILALSQIPAASSSITERNDCSSNFGTQANTQPSNLSTNNKEHKYFSKKGDLFFSELTKPLKRQEGENYIKNNAFKKLMTNSQNDSYSSAAMTKPNSKPTYNLIQKKLSNFLFEKKSSNKERGSDSSEADLSISLSKESMRKHIGDKPPHNYICFMNFHPSEKVIYTIFGFVTTLLSKLQQNDGKWHVEAKINDGTGSCDVDIDDGVLKEFIGMSVNEFKSQKEEAVFNPHLKNELGQRLRHCQMELIKMCRLLRIECSPSLLRPRIVGFIPLTEIHLQQLIERAKLE